MTRTYCDKCQKELTDRNKFDSDDWEITPVPGVKFVIQCETALPHGDVCKHCVLDHFNDLDDRPEAG